MTTPESKDHELLIRIDERLLMLNDKLANIEDIIGKHRSQSNENKKRLDELENCIYGSNGVEGIYQKVERHDKLLTKAIAYFTIVAVVIEFILRFIFHGGL